MRIELPRLPTLPRASLALLAASSVVAFGVSACGGPHGATHAPETLGSTPASVSLPETPVEDQGKFGICWAYGTTGLIESEYKTRTGEDVDLSEEAVAFWHLAEMITRHIRETVEMMDYISWFTRGINEGFYTRLPPAKRTTGINAGDVDALELSKIYGLVPESAWNFKIPNTEARTKLFSVIRANALRYTSGRMRSAVTLEEVADNILVGEGAFPSRPPASFEWKGATVTARDFREKVLAFDPDAYEAFEATSEASLDSLIDVTKKALARGVSVPFAFPINVDRIVGDRFTAGDASLDNSIAFSYDGGHLTLVTDFVNVGGKEGALPPEELARELARPARDLSHFVMKNSWGLGVKKDDEGKVVGDSADGHYDIDLSYLVGSARGAGKGFTNLIVVVPRDLVK